MLRVSISSPERVSQLGDKLQTPRRFHATFGELAQGYSRLPNGSVKHWLFTLPIEERWSSAICETTRQHQISDSATGNCKPRSTSAARMLLQYISDSAPDVQITLNTNIPEAKGFASSTADINATCDALLCHLRPSLNSNDRESLIRFVSRQIEAGDDLFHPGITYCMQREHCRLMTFPPTLGWSVVGIDEGGQVNTAEVHQTDHYDAEFAREYRSLSSQLCDALQCGDERMIGQLATRSAIMQQSVLPKAFLTTTMDVCKEVGGLGVVVAHSGTLIGILIKSSLREALGTCVRMLSQASGHKAAVYTVLAGSRLR